jgi:fructoselysine-6-P-deglycase FrlB-like protein
MSTDRTRVDDFLDDILAGPDELALVLDQHRRGIAALPAEALARPRWRFIGMGSSRFAALEVAAAMRAAGRDAVAELASASSWSPPRDDTLVVAISNSGRTPEVVAAAEHHRGISHVVAVTSRPDSALAARADAVLPLVGSRSEAAGVATLSYRSTVAALLLLAAEAVPALVGNGIAAAVPALEQLLRERSGRLADGAGALDTGRPVHVLGDGARMGTVEQAALMLREAPRLDAAAYDTGEWLHVGLYTQFPGDAVLLLAGSAADAEAIATIRSRGGVVVAVGPRPDDADLHLPLPDTVLADPVLRALVEPVIAELLAVELWRRADARVLGEGPAGS